MRHVEIGVIKQVKTSSMKSPTYLVSLFRHREVFKFDQLNDAKVFCEDTAHVVLAEGEVSAVCFRYKRASGYSSYLMFDYLWDGKAKNHRNAKISEYEETEFEYMDSHAWISYWKKAKKVNERSYSAGDVLRASISHSPFSAAALITFSSMLLAAIIILLSVVFYNSDTYMSKYSGTVDSLVFIQAFVVFCGLASIVVPYVKIIKIIKAHNRNFNEVDWKEIFKKRQKFTYVTIGFISISILLCIAMFALVHHSAFSDDSAKTKAENCLIVLIALHMFRLSLILLARLYTYVRIARLVHHLFGASEWDGFKKWMKATDPIWEFRTNVDFFIIPHQHSLPFVTAEKEIVNSIIKESDTQEIKQIANRARRGYKAAIKKYFDTERGKHDHIR